MANVLLTKNGKQLFGYDENKKELIDHLIKIGYRRATEKELLAAGYIVSEDKVKSSKNENETEKAKQAKAKTESEKVLIEDLTKEKTTETDNI